MPKRELCSPSLQHSIRVGLPCPGGRSGWVPPHRDASVGGRKDSKEAKHGHRGSGRIWAHTERAHERPTTLVLLSARPLPTSYPSFTLPLTPFSPSPPPSAPLQAPVTPLKASQEPPVPQTLADPVGYPSKPPLQRSAPGNEHTASSDAWPNPVKLFIGSQ